MSHSQPLWRRGSGGEGDGGVSHFGRSAQAPADTILEILNGWWCCETEYVLCTSGSAVPMCTSGSAVPMLCLTSGPCNEWSLAVPMLCLTSGPCNEWSLAGPVGCGTQIQALRNANICNANPSIRNENAINTSMQGIQARSKWKSYNQEVRAGHTREVEMKIQ